MRTPGIPRAKIAAYCGLVLAGVPTTKAALMVRSTHAILKQYVPADWFGHGASINHRTEILPPLAAPRGRQISVGQRAAMYGLLLAGLSGNAIALILGVPQPKLSPHIQPDWMPKARSKKILREKPPRTTLQHADVIALHDGGGKTLQEVGDHFGVTREFVRQILQKHGVSARRGGGLPREVHQDRLQRYYKALQPGVATLDACAVAGVTYPEVQVAAKALGVTPPKPIRKSRLRYQEIAKFYEANTHMTGLSVARHFGVNPNSVSKALRVMGVTPRHRGWSHAARPNGAMVSP